VEVPCIENDITHSQSLNKKLNAENYILLNNIKLKLIEMLKIQPFALKECNSVQQQ